MTLSHSNENTRFSFVFCEFRTLASSLCAALCTLSKLAKLCGIKIKAHVLDFYKILLYIKDGSIEPSFVLLFCAFSYIRGRFYSAFSA